MDPPGVHRILLPCDSREFAVRPGPAAPWIDQQEDSTTLGIPQPGGRPAVFAVFADTRKISGYHVRGWLPQWVWPTC
eukprot:COSAG01_NODE_4328_length_5129_cov_15.312724_9_plen_76_part_01